MKKTYKFLILAIATAFLLAGCSEKKEPEEKGQAKPPYEKDVKDLKGKIDKYKDVNAAIADGYMPFAYYEPMVGYMFRNMSMKELTDSPNVLLYVVDEEKGFVLTGAEWLYPKPLVKDVKTPIEGAKWEFIHEASAHYKDGTEISYPTKEEAIDPSPETNSPLDFWHPEMVGFRVWTHMDSPDGPLSFRNKGLAKYEKTSPTYHPLEKYGIKVPEKK